MELLAVKKNQTNGHLTIDEPVFEQDLIDVSTDKPFIQANTEESSLQEIKDNHIIPVFIKDNEPLISHSDFIEATLQVASEIYAGETILSPNIRVSHPIKGRIPEAKNKPANELMEHEKTIYYERMAFIIEVPSISDEIDGSTLSLTIGGIKAYNLDNLYSKQGSDEHFKIFVGFKNKVCTNLKIWSDGYMGDLKVSSIGQLVGCIRSLLEKHNAVFNLNCLKKLNEYSLSENQFAHLIGRCRMYQHLPKNVQKDIPQLLFGDNQLSAIVKDYYKDKSFCRDNIGNINLWKLYNLFTGTNKSSYIDSFIDKSVNAYHFIEKIKWALEEKSSNWYLI
ncbi:MAG: DUF3871 family protein [Chitinophagaceae bacterium]